MSNFFSNCNMVVLEEMTITKGGEDIKIPLLFHIKDIYSTTDTVENNLVFFNDNRSAEDRKEVIVDLLHKVNLPLMVYDEDFKEYFEDNNLKPVSMKPVSQGFIFSDYESLYNFLININFNEVDFALIQRFILNTNEKIIEDFKNMVERELKMGDKQPNITEAFMSMRVAMEHSCSPIFPENVNSSVSQHSFREYFVKRAYLGRKMELEDIIREQAKKEAKENKRGR